MRVRGTGEGVKWEESLADAWGDVRAVGGDEVVAASDGKFGKGGEAKGGEADKQGSEGRRYVVQAGR